MESGLTSHRGTSKDVTDADLKLEPHLHLIRRCERREHVAGAVRRLAGVLIF